MNFLLASLSVRAYVSVHLRSGPRDSGSLTCLRNYKYKGIFAQLMTMWKKHPSAMGIRNQKENGSGGGGGGT